MNGNSPGDAGGTQREQALFTAALERPAEERATFLDGACHGDPALRQRLEALLAAHEQPATELAGADSPTVKADEGIHEIDEAVGQTLGRYKLLERVGEGGCGVVYVAEQTEPVRRRVALKVIKLGMDTKQVVARFEAERQALAMMDHPNIAKVLDAGTTEAPHPVPLPSGEGARRAGEGVLPAAAYSGRPYFVMELVRGIKITDYCDQANLSTKDRLDLFIKICQAIQHAHQKGIIHRDIKPSNILVTLHDGVPVPKVIDFGIAKATEGRLTDATVYTQLHQFIGTPAYMSPEQAEMSGLDIDTRSDIYSLGVLLYELLAGSTPFDAQELMASGIDAMRKTIREKEPQRPSTRLATLGADQLTTTAKRRSAETSKLLHQLQGDLDWIVMKCLEKDRQRRYETANGLAADLKRHLDNEPVVARPPSAAYKLQKAFRRNKLVYACGAAVAAALVVALVFSGWSFLRERKARMSEQAQRQEAERLRLAAETSAAREREQRSRVEALAYATDMNLTLQALEVNNLGRSLSLLNRNRPVEGRPDRRGWEWRYLWNRSRSDEVATIGPHNHHVTCVTYSPVGDLLASGGWDGKVLLWNWKSHREAGAIQVEGRVQSLAFSPDGRWLAVRRNLLGCQVWDVATRREIFELKDPAGGGVRGPVAFSPKGDLLAMSTVNGKIQIWNTQNQSLSATLVGHQDQVTALVFSRDGRRLFSGGDLKDRSVCIWDLSTSRAITFLKGHSSWVTALAMAPDESLLASCSGDGTVRIWDVALQREKLMLTNNAPLAWDASFSPDGRHLATCGADQRIRFWDTSTWKQVQVLKGHLNEVWCLAFSPDGREVATGGKDDTVKIWRAEPAPETPTDRLFPLRPFDRSGSLSPNGSWFTTVAGNRVTLGDTINLRDVREFSIDGEPGTEASITANQIDSNGQRVYLGYASGRIRAFDLNSGRDAVTLAGHSGVVNAIGISRDGTRLASGSLGGKVQVHDTSTGHEIVVLSEADISVHSLCFSRDGLLLAGGSQLKDEIVIWDMHTGAVRHRLSGHKDRITGTDFSPDGRLLASGSWDGTAGLWDLGTGQRLATLRAQLLGVNSVAFSPDGQRLAGGTGDGLIKLWSVADYQEILSLSGHHDINMVAFLPDETLVSVSPSFMQLWPAPPLNEINELEARLRKTP